MGPLVFLVLIGAGVWLNAYVALRRVRSELRRMVWALERARWYPTLFTHAVRFRFTAARDGSRRSGRALAGTFWWGPLFSDAVRIDFDSRT